MAWKQFDDERFTAIADAIRSKGRTTETIKVGELASSISNLPDYTNKWLSILDRSVTEITDEDMAGVTQVREHLFQHCYKLEKCALPEGIIAIGGGCFQGDLKLKNIKLPSTLSVLEGEVFMGCTSLTSIKIPALSRFGIYVFSGCSQLSEVQIEEGNLQIPSRTFSSCTSLTNIVLPKTITSIGDYAFYNCSKLVTIECRATTPPTLTDATSLPGTSIVKYIYVPAASVDAYKAAPYWSDYADVIRGTKFGQLVCREYLNAITADDLAGVTKIKDYGALSSKITSLELSNTIDTIGAISFYGNENLTKVVIPDSVTVIGENNRGGGFTNCKNLTKVVLGKNLNTIYQDSFASCIKLTTVVIHAETPIAITDTTFLNDPLEHIYVPANAVEAYKSSSYWALYTDIIEAITDDVDEDTVGRPGTLWDKKGQSYWLRTIESIDANDITDNTNVGGYCFQYCKKLTDVNLSNHKGTYIGTQSFQSCTALTHVVFPSTYVSISRGMFQGCTALTTFEIRATTPPTLNADVFTGCSNLKYIYVPADSVTAYKTASGWSDYADIIYGSKFAHAVGRELTAITADDLYYPDNYSLRDSLFQDNTNLKTVELSNKITSIGSQSFMRSGITSIVIPNSVQTIGVNNAGNSFYLCPLTKIVIGTGVTTINPDSFYTESTTYTIICKAVEPPALGNDSVFNPLSRVAHIYVPAASVDAYKAASRWSNYASVIEAITDDIDVDTTGRSGQLADQKMQNYVKRLCTEVTKEELGSITKIGFASFGYFRKLTYVSLPDTITQIGNGAFTNCTALTTIELRSTTPPTLSSTVFSSCTALKYIYVPADSVEAYKTAERWSAYADIIYGTKFAHAVGRELTTLTADDLAGAKFRNYVFAASDEYPNDSLISVEIPNTFTTIEAQAFYRCHGLKQVIIPDSVTTIGNNNTGNSFVYCNNLSLIIIGTGLTTFNSHDFYRSNTSVPMTIVIKQTIPPPITATTFPKASSGIVEHIYVPDGCVDAYKAADNWSAYASVIEVMPDEYAKIDTTGRAGTQWDTMMGKYLMRGIYDITEDMLSGITKIGYGAFSFWTNLNSIAIPEGITVIDGRAFASCTKLTTLTLPSTVTYLGDYCFVSTSKLTTLTCLATTPPTIAGANIGLPAITNIYVPSASVDAYKTATYWSAFADKISAIP